MYQPKKNDDKENYSLVFWSVLCIIALTAAVIKSFNGNMLAAIGLWVVATYANTNANHAELMEEVKKLGDKINS